MSEYKRLTCQKWTDDIDLTEEYGYSYIYKRLYELEDKIESGTLRDFPCNIGDEVFWAWDLDKQYSQSMRGVVIGLSISHKNTAWFSVKYDSGLRYDHTVEDYWLKSVFPTKAEAEARLKELQEKE